MCRGLSQLRTCSWVLVSTFVGGVCMGGEAELTSPSCQPNARADRAEADARLNPWEPTHEGQDRSEIDWTLGIYLCERRMPMRIQEPGYDTVCTALAVTLLAPASALALAITFAV